MVRLRAGGERLTRLTGLRRSLLGGDAPAGTEAVRVVHVPMTAADRRRVRRRLTAPDGVELRLAFPTGTVLLPGSVLDTVEGTAYVVTAASEDVAAVTPRSLAEAARVAHAVGNLHRDFVEDGVGFILGLTVVGAYAINNNPFDIFVMLALGFFGFLLKRGGFPLAQVVLGMVLGPLLEQNFMVSVIKVQWDLASFFTRPIALVLMLATLLVIVFGIRLNKAYQKSLQAPAAGTDVPVGSV